MNFVENIGNMVVNKFSQGRRLNFTVGYSKIKQVFEVSKKLKIYVKI